MANKYKITPKYTIPTGVAGNYRKGHKQVEGVVVHASANPNASIDAEIDYMTRNYKNAFTHAWAGHDKIIEISNTDYACWGAGAIANKRFAQIETTEDKRLTKKQKLQVIDHAAYWAAVQLVYYKLPCKDASKDGNGTVWGHVHVSKYLGGTDHTDPIAYFNSVGVSWNDFYKQVERYYNAYKKGASDQVKSLDGTQGTVKPSTPTPSKPNKPATPSKPSSGSIVDYLNSQGKDSSFSARKKLANQYGIKNYKGTAKQNIDLLNKLKSGNPAKQPRPKKSINQMAQEVIAGKHGAGHANRRNSLGLSQSEYNKVRAEVNRLAGVKTGLTVEQMANKIINDKNAPTGHEARRKWLGIDNATYQKVRARVNQKLK